VVAGTKEKAGFFVQCSPDFPFNSFFDPPSEGAPSSDSDTKKAGDYLTFKILRDGETMEIQVRLMEDSSSQPN